MTELETALNSLVHVFQKHCGSEEDPPQLKRSQLRGLLREELPHLMEQASEAALHGAMEALDQDGDALWDFRQFMTLVTTVTVCCHHFFQQDHEQHEEHVEEHEEQHEEEHEEKHEEKHEEEHEEEHEEHGEEGGHHEQEHE